MQTNTVLQMNPLDHIGLPVVVFADDYSILQVNCLFSKLFSGAGEGVVGKSFSDVVASFFTEEGLALPGSEFPENYFEPSNPLVQLTTIGINVGRNKTLHWYRVVFSPGNIHNNRSGQIVVTFTDVTGLVGEANTQKQIALAKNEWENTVDAIQDIVTIQNKDMEIVRANKVAHELFGFQLGELKGRKCHEVFFRTEGPCPGCPILKAEQESFPQTGLMYNELLGKTFRVSFFPIFDEDGEIYQFVHVAKDVSQYLEDASEKNRLMAAIEQTSDSVVMTDLNGIIKYVNSVFEQVSGYSREEVLGKKTNVLRSGEHNQRFYQSMWETLLAKKVWRGKLRNRHKNGTLYTEDVTIVPVLGSGGEIINFVATKRDITREEQLEQQLHHATRIEALGTLAGGIAHDFNNILSAMIGYGEMAKGKLDRNHSAQGDIQQILNGGDRAVDLIKQILTFGRHESHGEFHVVKLQRILRESIEFLRPSIPATIELIHEIDETCSSVYADPSQLYQVIMNLCTNSRQAIGDGHGIIKIRLREVDARDGGAVFGLNSHANRYILLDIIDTGCGVEDVNLPKLFDPFFTTKPKEQGTGLGLAVVHGIIKKHNGEIRVSSKSGKGTVVSIYLPVDGRGYEGKKMPAILRQGGNERIMIIDDEILLVNVLSACLKKVGYRVTSYIDSIEAVTAFRENPNCCDLVITDMLMPNMTGAELAREMLSIRKELPIIMLTGYSEHFNKEKSIQIGLKEYLFKPVKNEILRTIVRKVLDNGENIDH
ncbi:MAG: hypothetical protein COA36_06425 [Desulfotalea sp.]|nr:MAG: hypothetical protein COA36_06425 [Desulfotalea sp.]